MKEEGELGLLLIKHFDTLRGIEKNLGATVGIASWQSYLLSET